jgi:hypothetical protein
LYNGVHSPFPPLSNKKIGQALLDAGPVLAPATIRRLASEAYIVTVLEDGEGNVLNVGRKTRTVPPAIRRALLLRDRGCRFPGCCESKYVDDR